MNRKLHHTPGIYLVGFMGSGKSTIGPALASHLGWTFVDLDQDIEASHHTTVSAIFEQQGEPAFRRIESAALEARVNQVRGATPLVLALGGGAFMQPGNRELLAPNGISIWLDCPFDRLDRRIAGTGHRPLARDPAAFRKLFEARREVYALADYRILIDSDDPMDAVRHILEIPGLL